MTNMINQYQATSPAASIFQGGAQTNRLLMQLGGQHPTTAPCRLVACFWCDLDHTIAYPLRDRFPPHAKNQSVILFENQPSLPSVPPPPMGGSLWPYVPQWTKIGRVWPHIQNSWGGGVEAKTNQSLQKTKTQSQRVGQTHLKQCYDPTNFQVSTNLEKSKLETLGKKQKSKQKKISGVRFRQRA